MKFTCEITRIENPNEQQLGRKPARHEHLAWSEDTALLRELYSPFPKVAYIYLLSVKLLHSSSYVTPLPSQRQVVLQWAVGRTNSSLIRKPPHPNADSLNTLPLARRA
uniref:SFRICE_020859 n=1 Tax=Spodoptera frugiperda TaxID=7108 RepID=A0A2H1VZ30_SPOFR